MVTMTTTRRPTSNRILQDVVCRVCKDLSSGKHYGIYSCDGCAGFFKRSIRKRRRYNCKSKGSSLLQPCPIDKSRRNQCRSCRLQKCLEVGMNKDAVQHERGPRTKASRSSATAIPMLNPDTWLSPPAPHFTSLLPYYSPLRFPHFVPPYIGGLRGPLFYPVPKYALPTPQEPAIPPQDIQEFAANVLVGTLHWVKANPSFTALPIEDQLLLLAEGWRELFILAAAQNDMPQTSSFLMGTIEPGDPEKVARLTAEVGVLQSLLVQIKEMQLDAIEFQYLKLIALVKGSMPANSDKSGELKEPQAVAALYENLRAYYAQHVTRYPPVRDPMRLQRAFALLAALRGPSEWALEELFFLRSTNGVPLSNLLKDLYMDRVPTEKSSEASR